MRGFIAVSALTATSDSGGVAITTTAFLGSFVMRRDHGLSTDITLVPC